MFFQTHFIQHFLCKCSYKLFTNKPVHIQHDKGGTLNSLFPSVLHFSESPQITLTCKSIFWSLSEFGDILISISESCKHRSPVCLNLHGEFTQKGRTVDLPRHLYEVFRGKRWFQVTWNATYVTSEDFYTDLWNFTVIPRWKFVVNGWAAASFFFLNMLMSGPYVKLNGKK